MNSVTINNCVNQGTIHTWLSFKTGEHSSFNPANFPCALASNCEAIIESDEIVVIPEVKKEFFITIEQFNQMIIKKQMLSTGRKYALIPLQEGEYSCVKASRDVLQAGGIDFLDDLITPFGVEAKINGNSDYSNIDHICMLHGAIPRAAHGIVEAVTGKELNEGGASGYILFGVLAFTLALVLNKVLRTR